MDLTKYDFRVERESGNVRIVFLEGDVSRYRTLKKCDSMTDEEILKELQDYIETGETTVKPIPQAFVSIRGFVLQDKSDEEMDSLHNEILDSYAEELDEVKNKLRDAIHTINRLENVIEVLKCKNKNEGITLTEDEIWHVLAVLREYYDMRYSGSTYDTVRKVTLQKILDNVEFDEDKEVNLINSIRKIYSMSNNLDTAKREFSKIGFEVTKIGENHPKIYPMGYPEISIPLSLTPSDHHNRDNIISQLVQKMLR